MVRRAPPVSLVLLALLSVSCGPKEAPVETPASGPGSATWTGGIQKVFAASCTGCHSSALQGEARHGAPERVDYDTPAAARLHAKKGLSLVVRGRMPPDGKVSQEERDYVRAWIKADYPE